MRWRQYLYAFIGVSPPQMDLRRHGGFYSGVAWLKSFIAAFFYLIFQFVKRDSGPPTSRTRSGRETKSLTDAMALKASPAHTPSRSFAVTRARKKGHISPLSRRLAVNDEPSLTFLPSAKPPPSILPESSPITVLPPNKYAAGLTKRLPSRLRLR